MPQDGSGNYQYPLGTRGVPDETIESAAYNNFLDDLVGNDLNFPRPIHRGGTGATTADAALVNLGAEKAAQLVTNYDTHVWFPGSFRSAGSATAGPIDGHAFAGIVYINEPLANPPTNANVTVSARDMTDSKIYVRQKIAGTWGVWVEQASADANYVSIAGDTMTGDLIIDPGSLSISAPDSVIFLNRKTASHIAQISSSIGDTYTSRWSMILGDANPETGSNVGSDFQLQAFNDAGAALSIPLHISRTTGLATVTADPTQSLGIATKQYVDNAAALNYDSLSYLGMQINGAFLVNQDRAPGVPNTVAGAVHITDGWRAFHAPFSNSTISVNQRGMNQYTHLPFNTPAALAAGDTFYLYTGIEGYRANRLTWGNGGADTYRLPMTISFLSAHARTGTYCVAIQNAAHDQSYVATYVQAAANVEQFNAITIPPALSGTWDRTNGVGMYIYFSIGIGSTYQTATPNVWQSGNKLASTGSINAYETTADRIRLNAIMINAGNVAPPVERIPFLIRPYDEEFTLCQRYYQALNSSGLTPVAAGFIQAATTAYFSYRFPTQMRVAPAFSAIAPSNLSIYAGATSYVATAVTATGLHPEGARLDVTSSGMTVGQGALLAITSVGTPTLMFNAGFA